MSVRAFQLYESFREDLAPERIKTLKDDVRRHYQELARAQRRSELIAVDLAEALCTRLEVLLSMAHLMDPEARAHIVGAARYFVSSLDERPDEQSCTGLDDDVEVFNHVAELIARADLIIEDE